MLQSESGPVVRVARDGESLILNQTTSSALAYELLLDRPLTSAMLVPLRGRGMAPMALVTLNCDSESANSGNLRFFQLLADQGAIALQNAQLVEALRAQTELVQRSREQLVHSTRMSTVGRLTAALAHEINNPLQSILGSIQYVREQLPADFAGGRVPLISP